MVRQIVLGKVDCHYLLQILEILHKKNDEMRYWYTPWHIVWQYSVKCLLGFSSVFVDVDLYNVYRSVIPTNVGMEGDYFGR